jgi:hypothetical protein
MKLIDATFMGLVHVDAVVIRTPAVYTVYLTHQRSDTLPVTVVLPALDHDVVTFAFPRMVRGASMGPWPADAWCTTFPPACAWGYDRRAQGGCEQVRDR